MSKKAVLLFSLLVVAASFLSYSLGSGPVALAKSRPTPQETSDQVPPPLPAPPAEWTYSNIQLNTNTVAEVLVPAGGSGVQHVADCVSFGASLTINGSGTRTVTLRNGTATGPILMQWVVALPFWSQPADAVHICGLNAVGSLNTPMFLGFSAASNVTYFYVNLVGHDAT